VKIEDLINYEDDESLKTHLCEVIIHILSNNELSNHLSPDVGKIVTVIDNLFISFN